MCDICSDPNKVHRSTLLGALQVAEQVCVRVKKQNNVEKAGVNFACLPERCKKELQHENSICLKGQQLTDEPTQRQNSPHADPPTDLSSKSSPQNSHQMCYNDRSAPQ